MIRFSLKLTVSILFLNRAVIIYNLFFGNDTMVHFFFVVRSAI